MKRTYVRNSLFWILLVSLWTNCVQSDQTSRAPVPRNVKQYCGSCHLIPDPKSLTKEIWSSSILPKMSEFFIWQEKSEYDYANMPFYNKQGQVPMNDEDWSEIVDYYLNNGLDSASIITFDEWPIQTFFDESHIKIDSSNNSAVTAIHIGEQNLIANDGYVYTLDSNFNLKQTLDIAKDITHFYFYDDEYYMTYTSTINPHEGPFGGVSKLSEDFTQSEILFERLQRPVQMHICNNDILVSEFGYKTGKLSLRSFNDLNLSKDIHNLPGSYRIIPAKMSNSSEETFVITSSQAQESIMAMIHKDGNYSIKEMIRYRSEYGLSDVDVADINNDGLDDLLVVNGDNADFSIIPKNYHGVKVYINRGNFKFREAFSFNIHGATQGKFVDVDQDGNIDIMVSCFFSEQKEHSLVLLKNKAERPINFSPYGFNNSSSGNWMIMESGDINGDQKPDVILGSYNKGPKENDESYADLLILKSR